MTTPKPKGGKRPGAGAKKTGRRKIWLSVAVREDRITANGGKDSTKILLQEKANTL